MPENEANDVPDPVDISPIIWGEVYELIHKVSEYEMLMRGLNRAGREAFKKPDLFTIPVIASITYGDILDYWDLPEVGNNVMRPQDLDKQLARSDRSPATGPYIVSFSREIKDYLYLSVNDLDGRPVRGMTGFESMLLDLGRYKSLRMNPYQMEPTIWNGSRYPDGSVPYSHWDNDFEATCIDKMPPNKPIGTLCVREVVDFIRVY